MKSFLLILFLSLSGLVVAGQDGKPGDRLYTTEELREDYLIFRKALETTYPSLFRFSDTFAINRYLDDQYNRLDASKTELDLYRMIVLACSKANDEHLIPTPSKDYYRYLQNTSHYFPFSLKIINRRIYVLGNYMPRKSLPVGSELLSINGYSTEDILNILLPTIPSDGYIQTFNTRHLEDYSMTQNENLFDLNYSIFIEDTSSFRIEFIHPDNKRERQTAVISGLDYKSYKEFYQQRIGYKAPLEFKYLKREIAYLRISSFLRYHRTDFKQDFISLYDSIFGVLNQKKTKNLILDLRNNEGGDGTGEKLITYLLTKPYKHYDYTEEIYTGYPPVVEYLENGKDLYFPDSLVYKTSFGTYRLKKEYFNHLYNVQEPERNNFKGKIYVLVNGASGSMASVVATFLKATNRAIFIGEECGGTMEGNTSDSYGKLVLPNTGIRVEIPLTKKVNNVNYIKGRGVFPDYSISPDINDILNGIDTELSFALGLINQGK
ncbi:MAG: S41 family peptidase [Chitinophagaceae bacterium]